jgi:hypothetical protein
VNRRLWLVPSLIAALAAVAVAVWMYDIGTRPRVVITQTPQASEGGPEQMAQIAGRISGASADHRIVLFAKSGAWFVQPLRSKPFTSIQADLTWTASTHLGSEYAALLVREGYQPPSRLETLPDVGNDILAIARVQGAGELRKAPQPATIRFSGYEWRVRRILSKRAGPNEYDARNVRVADDGALHLSLVDRGGWTSAEVSLTRTLGYGTYAFVVRDLSALDPAALLTLFTYDDEGPGETFREMNIQLQRVSPDGPIEGQSIVQPNYIAGNISRYAVPSGTVTHWFRWEPGRVVFGASPGSRPALHSSKDRGREFTIGVPTTGKEQVRINLCYFRKSPVPPKRNVEVVIERFQYFP